MSATITCAMSKGGSGKTTTATILLGALSALSVRVAGIDSDPNSTLSNWASGISKAGIDVRHITDETLIIPTVTELEQEHDLVIVDTAGAALQATIYAIGAADLVIVPVQASSADVVEAAKTVERVRSAATMVKRDIAVRVLLTDHQPNTEVARHTESELEKFSLPMLETKLHRLVAFKEMTFTGAVPTSNKAGEQVRALLDELRALNIVPK